MKKLGLLGAVAGIAGLLALLWATPPGLAQWGAIGSGIDAARRAAEPSAPSSSSESSGVHNVADEATAGPGLAATTTYQNKVRPFSYTIPAGWRLEGGNPEGERVQFMKPGTTAGFTFHFTQMVPSFPRGASVDASLKHAKEEMSIGKYIAVKRRDQGDRKTGVIGWETTESAKGSGGFQRIQWQCYDGQNYYYSFIAHCDPAQFATHRAAMQGIIDSIRFRK